MSLSRKDLDKCVNFAKAPFTTTYPPPPLPPSFLQPEFAFLHTSIQVSMSDSSFSPPQSTSNQVSLNDANIYPPLYFASSTGDAGLVRDILESGVEVDVDCEGSFGRTPLWEASRLGYSDIVDILLQAGADVNKTNQNRAFMMTPLHVAAATDRTEIVDKLISYGADVNKAMSNGDTPLRTALRKGHTETAAKLQAAGAYMVLEAADETTV